MNRTILINILKIIVSVALLAFIFSQIDVEGFFNSIRNADLRWLLAALGMMLIGVMVRALRWQILLNAIGVYVSLAELTAIYFIGFLFNNLLPSGLGGDAIRMLELKRHANEGSDTVTSVIVDRFLGLAGLQAIALIGLVIDWDAVPVSVAFLTIFLFLATLTAGTLLINRPLYLWLQKYIAPVRWVTGFKAIRKLFESFQGYRLSALGLSFLVSLVFNITLIIMHIFIGLALGVEATFIQYLIFIPITSIVLLVPLGFGGLGTREVTYTYLFGQVGVLESKALAMSLLVYTIGNVCTGLIGGVIYLIRGTQNIVSEQASERKESVNN